MSLKVHVIETNSDPVAAPEFAGQHWINTATKRQWFANGTDSVGDWAEIQSPSNLAETVRDTIASALTDSSSIDFQSNDSLDTITAVVLPAGVDHDALSNFVANEHINHASVAITAGTGLSGGGDITTSRTLNIANTGVTAATYGSSSQVPQVVVNAQGQITSASNVTITPAAIGAQPLDSDLTAVAGLAGTGLIARTGTGTATTRTVTGGTGISVANGDGVSGNPTVTNTDTGSAAVATHEAALDPHPQYLTSAEGNAAYQPLDADLTALSALTGTGIICRTGSNTYAERFIAVTTGLSSVNPGGVGGNPTIGIADTGVTAGSYGSASSVSTFSVGTTGQLSAASSTPIQIAQSQVNNLTTDLAAKANLSGGNTFTGNQIINGGLEVSSTTRPFIPPRMTSAQIDAIVSPTAGMVVYNTDLNCLSFFDGALWRFEIDLVVQNNQSSTSTTYADVTELITPTLPVGRYMFQFTGTAQSTSTATGVGVRLGAGTASISALSAMWNIFQAANGTDSVYQYAQLSPTTNVTSASTLTANTDFPVVGHGVFSLGTAGTVAIQLRTETAGSGVSIRINSAVNISRMTG